MSSDGYVYEHGCWWRKLDVGSVLVSDEVAALLDEIERLRAENSEVRGEWRLNRAEFMRARAMLTDEQRDWIDENPATRTVG